MTEKVNVSQEVADALVYLEQAGYDFTAAMEIQISAGWEDYEDENVLPLNNITAEAFAIALINGYEVEMTPHEVIATEHIASQQAWVNNKHFHSKGFAEGIEFTLDTLGIKIKGVNDGE